MHLTASFTICKLREGQLRNPRTTKTAQQRRHGTRVKVAAPWGVGKCPHCKRFIEDLLMEMVPKPFTRHPGYRKTIDTKPGGVAVQCPYCGEAVEFDEQENLVKSDKAPLPYSRQKFEVRTEGLPPEDWVAKEKGMQGALRNHQWEEDTEENYEPAGKKTRT